MASFFKELNDKLMGFIREQHIYFVATAAKEGRVNLSPKGMDTFRIFSPTRVGYLDLTGSGTETAAHIMADGRLTIMFCAFKGDPLILRLYGRGEVIRPDDSRWREVSAEFTLFPGSRQIILLEIESLQTSCGFAVPRYELVDDRQMLIDWANKKGLDGLAEYRAKKNVRSIDGLATGL
ncbi:MAG TPA: pyridoxamine 5'-phosphate oxidase family protein [Tepidisphaeraceae bacterium]|jgi:hypothetical protein|nr:pyridoxamine 5'-phosphate oxidase family protein [Tepidisphaeraceae bacterium]